MGPLPHLAGRGRNDRVWAAGGVAAIHVLIGYVLISGLAGRVADQVEERLKVFDVPKQLPQPSSEQPIAEAAPEEEGAAAPPNLKAAPAAVVAPPPKVKIETPPPVRAAPVTTRRPEDDPRAGASELPGPGTGAGGAGTGMGAGGDGSGTGGGGGSPAQWIEGSLRNADYPMEAKRAGIEGSVSVSFTVGTDGRVSACRVLRSSGSSDLDSTTCRVIERRFRYLPARDAQGRPRAETLRKTYDWYIVGRNR